ncbi:MAG: NYN domain-containing protein, partial [Thermoplasmata archaeon]
MRGPQGIAGPQGLQGNSLDANLFVSKQLYDRQVNRTYDSLGDSIQSLSSSLSDEVDTDRLIVSGNANIAGQGIFTKSPTLPHAFTTWPSGISNVSDSTVYINPASAATDTNLFGIAVDGSVKFLVDAEGDIYANSMVLSGSVTQGDTTVANLSVLGTFSQTGDETFSTGTGNISLNGATTITGSNTFTTGTGIVEFKNVSTNIASTNPVIDTTSASTLFINSVTNRPVTFGTGLLTANNFGSSSVAITGGTISGTTINNSTIGITTAVAGNFTTIGVTTPGSAIFTTITNSGNATLATGVTTTNTFGSGASSINTIGSSTTPGTLTLHGATSLDNTFSQTGANTFSTGTGAISLNGATTITGTNTFTTGTGATTVNSTAWTFANDTNFALTGGVNGLSFDTDTLSIDSTNDRIGIGTTGPLQKLDITGGSMRLDNTTGASPTGIIFKGASPFISDFNYGNNGTATTRGFNTFVGIGAGNLTMGSGATVDWSASYNTAVGNGALHSNTTGYNNTANGYSALYSNTTGGHNTAIGQAALYSSTTGYNNTGIGHEVLYSNTTGYWNTANGAYALNDLGSAQTAGAFNIGTSYTIKTVGTTDFTLIGAASNTVGVVFTATGVGAGTGTATPNGTNNNTALGYDAGRGIIYGTGNTILGANVTGLSAGLTNNIIIADGAGNRRINVDSAGNVGIGTTAPATKLDVTGLTLNTDATGTVMSSNFTGSITKNDVNAYTFSSVQIKPTLNTGVSNTGTVLNVLNIDTTNTAVTGLTTNLIKASYGGVQKFLVDSSGNATLAGTITSTGSITGAAGSFTTLTSSGASTIGTGASLTNTFGTGTSAANTIGVSGGTNAINGSTTILGTALINSTGSAATTIGNSTGALTLAGTTFALTAGSGLNVTTAGALSGITTIATSSTINSQTISATASFTGTVQAATSFLSPTFDTATAVAMNIGTVTQTGLTVGRVGATTAINGSSLTVGPTAWTATPTISGLITATSGLTANGTLTVGANQNFVMTSGTGTFTQTYTGTVDANTVTSSATGANNKALNVSNTGAVVGTGYAGYFSKTGAATTNIGLYATATGATNNYAAIFENGNVGIGIINPTVTLHVVGQCVTGDTKLRRRRKKKGAKGEEEEDYEYDEVRIDEIKAGDEILSLNEETGKLEYQKVKALMDMGTKSIYKLTTASGKSIRTTGNHPYLVKIKNKEIFTKPKLGVFYDNSNMFYAQKKAGWKIDLQKLKEELSGSFDVQFINFYTAVPEEGDDAREKTLKYMNFVQPFVSLITKPLKYIKTYKMVDGKIVEVVDKKGDMDVELVLDVTKNISNIDALLIVSGDSDLLPLKNYALSKGKKIVFAGFQNNIAWELRQILHVPIDNYRGVLGLGSDTDKKQAPSFGLGVALLNKVYSKENYLSSETVDKHNGLWTKVATLRKGQEIAIFDDQKAIWDKIVDIENLPSEQVYDIEIENTHNFVGNDIIAHNTYLGGNSTINGNTIAGTDNIYDIGASGATRFRTGYFGTSLIAPVGTFSGAVTVGTLNGNTITTGTGILTLGALKTLTVSDSTTLGTNAITLAGGEVITFSPTNALSLLTTASTSVTFPTSGTLYGTATGSITSAQLLSSISDETGTGVTVFSNTPTLVSPILGVASGTSLALGGATIGTNNLAVTGSAIISGNVGIGLVSPTANLQVAQGTAGAGTVSTTATLTTVTGVGTQFLNTFKVGDTITVNAETRTIATIVSNTSLTTDAWTGSNAGVAYTLTGGTRFSVLGNGNVGIGEVSPGSKLSVLGGISIGDATYSTVASPTGGAIIQGNVGIGTTSPQSKLHILGTTRFDNGDSGYYGTIDEVSGAMNLKAIGGGSYMTFSASGSEWMRILNSGNVGIGQTAPSSKLDITTAGLGVTQTTSSGLALVNTTAATVGAQQISPALRWSGFGWKTDAVAGSQAVDFRSYVVPVQGTANPTGYLGFGSSVNGGAYSDGQMVITTAGNIGIGTTGPLTPLHILSAVAGGGDRTGGISDLKISNSTAQATDVGAMLGFDQKYTDAGGYVGAGAAIRSYKMNSTTGDYGIGLKFETRVNGGSITTKMTIDSSGNVGIGTVSPGYPLEVAGLTNVVRVGDSFTSDGQNAGILFSNTNRLYAIRESSTSIGYQFDTYSSGAVNAVRIQGNGNVGIGTTAPAYQFHLNKSGEARILLTDSDQGSLASDGLYIRQYGLNTAIVNQENGVMQFGTNNSYAQTILANGNVGIGTTSPGSALQVRGTTASSGTSNPIIYWERNSDGAVKGVLGYDETNTKLYLGSYTSHPLSLRTNNADVMTLLTSGNVGIGTTGPLSILEVSKSGTANSELGGFYTPSLPSAGSNWIVLGKARTADQSAVIQYIYSSTAANQLLSLDFYNSTNNKLVIKGDGNVGIGQTVPTSKLDVTTAGLGVTQTTSSGLALVNTTAALVGAQQISPALRWSGFGWKTDATAGSQAVDFRAFITPVQGAANPTGYLGFGSSVNGGAYSDNQMVITTAGNVGIGQTAPLSKLGITGNASIGATYGAIVAPTSGMIIEGNVGIGEVSPGSKLSVSGGGSFGAGYDTTAAPTGGLIIEGNVGIGQTAPLSKLGITGNASIGATYGAIVAPTSGMIIEGNVGIGTTTIGSKLGVLGNLAIGGTYGALAAPTGGLI